MGKASDLFLGGVIDPATGERTDQNVAYDANDLTTHGVIVGMTGSGKTGLGMVLLEELLKLGVPTLIIDPKGDMGNLALRFPEFRGSDFRPWLDEAAIRREGGDPDAEAAATAAKWKSGLEAWSINSDDFARLARSDVQVYTPGSEAGTAVNVLGSMAAPEIDWDGDVEGARAEIENFVTGLLGLLDIDADPLSSKEHILISNLIEKSWRAGKDVDLATLIHQVQSPPLRKLGVFELDAFFPEKERMALAMRLNALIANPSFSSWLGGEPLDIGKLLWTEDGRPRASVMYLSHLSDSERQFVVTLVMSKLATWMQTQPGTSELRALVYMDEVFGFIPPTGAPPSKKPILTLLKQARAFGLGVVLSTQNPVDLDYKAMSNAGTWMIGRLQTERDKARILEALQSARGDSDTSAIDKMLSGLGKRQFLLHNTRATEPTVFTTRWAMSYLAGPLTKAQLKTLRPAGAATPAETEPALPTGAPSVTGAAQRAAAPVAAEAAPLGDDESAVEPKIADGIDVYVVDPGAPWLEEIGGDGDGTRFEAGLALRVSLTFDEKKFGLDHRDEWEAVVYPLTEDFDPTQAIMVDHDKRDLSRKRRDDARYVIPTAPIKNKGYFKKVQTELRSHLHRDKKIEVLVNKKLKVFGRPGESEADFEKRCAAAAGEKADAETAKMRKKVETKVKSVQRKIATADRQRSRAQASFDASKSNELVSGVGSVLGVLLGGKSSARSMARRGASAARSMSSKRSAAARSKNRLEVAEAKIEDLEQEITELEADVIAEIEDIDAKWTEIASDYEPVEVGLERNDVSIDSVALVWVPTV